jgi:diaminohydroxyphosphoribosylaminopyrimidine deaminase / 5-amino-6-(5-phosphoribosylamino)uracil reductase
MVGTNTALLDNPRLTVREHTGKNPLRIVLDRELRIPISYHLFDGSAPTLVFTEMKEKRSDKAEYVHVKFDSTLLKRVMEELVRRNIQSVIVEGGSQLLNSFTSQNLWDESRVLISRRRLGSGVEAPVLHEKPIHTEDIEGDELKIYRSGR